MASIKSLLLAGAALTLMAGMSLAEEAGDAPATEPPAAPETAVETPADPAVDAVALAEQNVAKARAAVRKAMASGKGIQAARQALAKALAALKEAQVAAGQTPTEEEPAVVETPPAETPAPAEPPVAEEPAAPPEAIPEPPVAAEPTPPVEAPAEPPVAEEPAAPAEPAAPPVAAEPTPPVEAPAEPPVAAEPEAPAAPAETPVAAEPPTKEPVPVVDAAEAEGGTPAPKSADGRVIVKEAGGALVIKHDEDARLKRKPGAKVATATRPDGSTVTTVNRPDGSQIVTVKDADGNIIRRTRKLPDGQVVVLIDSKPDGTRKKKDETVAFFRRLPPIVLNIPVTQYIIQSQAASPQVLELTLEAPPVEMVERPYTLAEIRESGRLRDKVRRIDIDTVTFEFGQATVAPDQVGSLDAIGRALAAVLNRDSGQVYLIEGHTDAVGTDVANLALSDRRAESVADILSNYYGIPPENLVTQGYGEQYLKVPTEQPERENRRVTVRNITPLLKADNG